MHTKFFEAQYAVAARDILLKYFNQKITATDIADRVGIGKKTLQRAFKNQFSMGIYEYQLQLRMEKAKELMVQGDKSLKQVAKLVGYKRQSSFSRKFNDFYGSAPTDWLNNGNGN